MSGSAWRSTSEAPAADPAGPLGSAKVALGVSATVHLLGVALMVAVVGPIAVRDLRADAQHPVEDGDPRSPLHAGAEIPGWALADVRPTSPTHR
jgi:hypothetical protein